MPEKKAKVKQSTFSTQVQAVAAQERGGARRQKRNADQTLSEQKAILKSSMKDSKMPLRQGSLQFQFGKKSSGLRRKRAPAATGSASRAGGEGSLATAKLRK